MRNTIPRFRAAYLLELRLTSLHWGYLLFAALWNVFIFFTYTGDDYRSLRGLFNFVLGFISLVGMFLTGIQASRAERTRFHLLEVALPTGVELLLARWLAVISALGGLLIAPILVVVIAPPGRLDPVYVLHNLLLILVVTAFATGLVWVLQTTIGVRRWIYPLFGLLWVGGGFLPNFLNDDGLPFPGSNLFNFITMNQSVNSSVWGQLFQGQLGNLTVWFYIGMVVMFAGIMLGRMTKIRFYRHSPVITALTAVGLVIMLFAGGSYTAQVYALNQQVLDEDRHQEAFLEQMRLPAEMLFAVQAYEITFASGMPSQVSVQMDVLNRSDTVLTELTFSLYHQFEMIEATFPFVRERDLLTFTLPEALPARDSTRIELTYQGNVAFMERRLGRPPEATYFIQPEGVYLACAILWYPIPGQLLPSQGSYAYQETSNCLLDQPASFLVTIEQPGQLQYTSNLTQRDRTTFISNGATQVDLIGAPALQTISGNPITVVATPELADQMVNVVNRYFLSPLEYLQRFFPQAQRLTVTTLSLVPDSFSQWAAYPATEQSLIVFIDPRRFDLIQTDTQSEYYEVGAPLFKSLFGVDNVLTENMAYFLWVHYKTGGEREKMQALLEQGLPSGISNRYFSVPFSQVYSIANLLYDVYVADGEQGVFALLNRMLEEMDMLSELSPEEVIGWIEENADAF